MSLVNSQKNMRLKDIEAGYDACLKSEGRYYLLESETCYYIQKKSLIDLLFTLAMREQEGWTNTVIYILKAESKKDPDKVLINKVIENLSGLPESEFQDAYEALVRKSALASLSKTDLLNLEKLRRSLINKIAEERYGREGYLRRLSIVLEAERFPDILIIIIGRIQAEQEKIGDILPIINWSRIKNISTYHTLLGLNSDSELKKKTDDLIALISVKKEAGGPKRCSALPKNA